MTTYRPSSVYTVVASFPRYPATIVGGSLAWSDDSDATHVDFGQEDTSSSDAQARANFPAVPLGSTCSLSFRAEDLTGLGKASLGFYDQALATSGGYSEDLFFGPLGWVDSGSFVVDDVTAASPMLIINNVTGGTGGPSVIDYRIYEVILYATPPGGSVQPYRAPLRLHPRSDARLWPRPGSAGASGRTFGGYY